MSTFTLLEQEISESLRELRLDPDHQLSASRRLSIYQALCPAFPALDLTRNYYNAFVATSCPSISIEHRRYGYLGILTAQHVLPIWDRSVKPADRWMPRKMLAFAEDVLKGIKKPSEVNGFYLEDFHHFLDMQFEVKYDAWCALRASYDALGMCLGAPPFTRCYDLDKNKFVLSDNDAAQFAVVAYSIVDDSEPGDWRTHFRKTRNKEWIFDFEKRLEFWEWWLTEAVPAAWRMAEEQEDRIDPAL